MMTRGVQVMPCVCVSLPFHRCMPAKRTLDLDSCFAQGWGLKKLQPRLSKKAIVRMSTSACAGRIPSMRSVP